MTIREIKDFLRKNTGYLKWGNVRLADKFNVNLEVARQAKQEVKEEFWQERCLNSYIENKQKRILVIGDTHIPYEKKGYLEFCKEQYDYYNCNEVVHIGDLIDLHATSFHPSIPEAYSAGEELKYTKLKLQEWYRVFPNMKVVRGNHDDRVFRLASNSGITKHWIRDFSEVLEVPNWDFQESYKIRDTLFVHGTGTSGVTAAYRRALNMGCNVVIGHLHTESSIIYHQINDKAIFGMIIGCGIDEDSYGMNYAKNMPKKSIISCGIILNDEPLLKIMK